MRTSRLAWTSLLLFVACGGPAEPAQAPEVDAAPAAEEPADDVTGSTPEDTAAGAKEPEPSALAGVAPSEGDLTAILQLVVDDPELDAYLHLGSPGRFPLRISGEKLPSGLKLLKATEPVKLVPLPTSKKDAVLVFTEIDVQGARATVRYRYDIEGVRGTVSLAKTPHGWELKNSRLVER